MKTLKELHDAYKKHEFDENKVCSCGELEFGERKLKLTYFIKVYSKYIINIINNDNVDNTIKLLILISLIGKRTNIFKKVKNQYLISEAKRYKEDLEKNKESISNIRLYIKNNLFEVKIYNNIKLWENKSLIYKLIYRKNQYTFKDLISKMKDFKTTNYLQKTSFELYVINKVLNYVYKKYKLDNVTRRLIENVKPRYLEVKNGYILVLIYYKYAYSIYKRIYYASNIREFIFKPWGNNYILKIKKNTNGSDPIEKFNYVKKKYVIFVY